MENSTAKKKRSVKKWPIVLAVIILLAAAAIIFVLTQPAAQNANIEAVTAEKGFIGTSVVGTGNLENLDAEKAETYAALKYSEITVETGDSVKAGDVLAKVEEKSVSDRINAVQAEIDTLDMSINRSSSGYTDKTLSSHIDGRIKAVYVAEGENVRSVMAEKAALMLISANGNMAVDFESREALKIDDYVEIVTADGDVRDGEIISAEAGKYTAEFDDYEIKENDSITVRKSDDTELGEGTAYICEPIEITAAEGRIDELYVSEEDYVYSGSSLMYITEISNSSEHNELIEDRKELTEELNFLMKLSETYELIADFEGEIAEIGITDEDEKEEQDMQADMPGASAGNIAETPDASTDSKIVAMTYYPETKMRLAINIDELDILNVSLRQKASVTFDAIEGEEYEGEISELDKNGVVTNGVAKYRAVIELDKTEKMRAGMNATATITIEEHEDALLIPIIAVQEYGDKVFVYTDAGGDTGIPAGEKEIETGISDGESVEILEGLSEGDTVYYVGEDSNIFSNFPMGGGMFRRGNANETMTVTVGEE